VSATAPDPHAAGGSAAAVPPLPPAERLQELLFDAARLGREDMIPALLQAGAVIEGQDARGYTALVLASYHGQEVATETLLRLGAHPDGGADRGGSTALMGVAFKGHLAVAQRLLAAGADPDRRNTAGQTALMMAALFDRREIVDLLLANGADPTLADASGATAADVADAQGNAALAEELRRLATG